MNHLASHSSRHTASESATALPPVSAAIGSLGGGIVHLRDVVNALAERLAPVLRPPVPVAGNTAADSDSRYLVDVADQVDAHAVAVRQIASLVEGLIERVAV